MLVYGREPILPTEANLLPPLESSNSNQIRDVSLAVRNLAAEHIKRRQNIDKLRYTIVNTAILNLKRVTK